MSSCLAIIFFLSSQSNEAIAEKHREHREERRENKKDKDRGRGPVRERRREKEKFSDDSIPEGWSLIESSSNLPLESFIYAFIIYL